MKKVLGHIFHKCHTNAEWDSYPRDDLDYQDDSGNEDYYSIYTQEEMVELLADVKVTGRFDVLNLFHFDDGWSHLVGDLLNAEVIDRHKDLPLLSRLHYQYFGNPEMAFIISCWQLKTYSVDELMGNLVARDNEADGDDSLRAYLSDLGKQQLCEKLTAELDEKPVKVLVKI